MAFDPRASETTPEEIAPAGREEAGLESAFCRASENRPIAEYHAIMGRSANSSLEKHRRSPVETPGRLNRNRGRPRSAAREPSRGSSSSSPCPVARPWTTRSFSRCCARGRQPAAVIDRAMAAIRVQHAELRRRRSEGGNGSLR